MVLDCKQGTICYFLRVFFCINFLKMWSVMCIVLLVVLCIVQNVNSNLINCQNERNKVVISNFDGHGEKNSNILFCKDDTVIGSYTDCHVNYMKLPIKEIAKMFPSVRLLNWACTGDYFFFVLFCVCVMVAGEMDVRIQ